MSDTMSEILQFVQENDVKFIRLSFCDLFGVQKNIAIMADQLPRAFQYGISFDASAVSGFGSAAGSDLFLVPDCSTVAILPWRPDHERVMRITCSVKNPDGTDFEADPRNLLKQAVNRAAKMGYLCRVGAECEFYLFQNDAAGNPSLRPLDNAGYGDISPLDKGEDIRRGICLALESMGITPESSHHERGPGQNEIDFRYSDPLTAADNLLAFKWVVKSIAARSGAFASFLPKPLSQESGNGMHINLSLSQGGRNLFEPAVQNSPGASSFIQGILERVPELTVFLNPLSNSYRRLGAFEAPKYLTWSHQNRSQLIRIPASMGEEFNRMELRSPDPVCNPYLAFALLIHAGLDGISQKKVLCEPCNENLYEHGVTIAELGVKSLPLSLGEAVRLAGESQFLRQVLPAQLLSEYLQQKQREWKLLEQLEDPHRYERETYFTRI